jgi:LPPG:FO 2-phospho-L-lactate transferase
MKVVALAGGVGGAKLVHGLAQSLPPKDLTVIVNTADDFVHLGLRISPDLDTICYTLAGIASAQTGWGRGDDTWQAMAALEQLGGPSWFRLGDQDLGTQLERTRRIADGQSLDEVVREFCRAWDIGQAVLPMTNDSVQTIVKTNEGDLPFQEYFVHRRCEPRVTGFRLQGADAARPAPGVCEALAQADHVVICPSNPWVSIDPILAIPGLRSAIDRAKAVAVSPIIGGQAVKGPAAKMYAELGIEPSALAVARHYQDLVSSFVLDKVDTPLRGEVHGLTLRVLVTKTLMVTPDDRRRLAMDVLDFVGTPEP